MSFLKLSGGTLYDPVHGVDGVVGDIWIENGKIVDAPKYQGSNSTPGSLLV